MPRLPKRTWTREGIKAEIRDRGITLEALSKSWGYSPKAVTHALSRPWPAIEARIAEFLDIPATELWPERYRADGSPAGAAGNYPARRAETRAAA